MSSVADILIAYSVCNFIRLFLCAFPVQKVYMKAQFNVWCCPVGQLFKSKSNKKWLKIKNVKRLDTNMY